MKSKQSMKRPVKLEPLGGGEGPLRDGRGRRLSHSILLSAGGLNSLSSY